LLALAAGVVPGASTSFFNAESRRWTLAGDHLEARFALTEDGIFRLESLRSPRSGERWEAHAGVPSSPIRIGIGNTVIDGASRFTLLEQHAQAIAPGGVRQVITLDEQRGFGRFRVTLEIFAGHPVLRWQVFYTNTRPQAVSITAANMAPWAFGDGGERFRIFRVNQWALDRVPVDFETLVNNLDPNGRSIQVFSGARGQQCGWVAIRDSRDRGLFAGWEFDGRARTRVTHTEAEGALAISSNVLEIRHGVPPREEFEVPAGFLGVYRGDWDEAGYRTQRFVEAVLAKPEPEPGKFPYVGWDSWAYHQNIDDASLRHEAELAARLGVELFTVDLGWALRIGDWRADPEKFPHGLRALSDYVHSLGMRFGLHFAFAEADPESAVLRVNPDWRSSETYGYYGAESICLSHQPVRDWVVREAIRMIDEYNVDWILQDGENMVKRCTKTTHTHDPADSNYANAIDGLAAVVDRIQAARPHVAWENCENGGNMMTFGMVRRYVTSITNDASGAYSARRSVFGATYPFPPRYTTRYMPQHDVEPGLVQSYLFGGPWQLMIRLRDQTAEQMELLRSHVALFKEYRELVQSGKVYHLTAPEPTRIDAIAYFDIDDHRGVALVSRPEGAPAARYQLRLRDLDADAVYRIMVGEQNRTFHLTGEALMNDGIRIDLPRPQSAALVYFELESR
jgi:hypothetical protein